MRALQPLLVPLAFAALGLSGCVDRDIRLGDDALGAGRYTEAIAAYQRAQARLPADATPTARIASAHRSQAMSLLQAGRCAEARAPLAEAEALSKPLLIDHQLVYECAARGPLVPEERAAMLSRLVELGDQRARVLRALMVLELDLGRPEAAASRVEALERRSPLTLSERARMMVALLDAGHVDAAWPQMRVVMRSSLSEAKDPMFRLKFAEELQRRGESADALAVYAALAQDYPTNPLTHLRLAEQYAAMGDADAARAARAHADALRAGALPPTPAMRPLPKSRR